MRDVSPLVVGMALALLFVMLVESLAFMALARRAMVRAERAQLRAEAARDRAEGALGDIIRIQNGEALHRAGY